MLRFCSGWRASRLFNLPPEFPPGGDFNLTTIVVGLVMSFWGGLVSFLIKVRSGALACSIRDFVFEIVICLFAGSIIFMLCVGAGIPMTLCGGLAGLGGHYGARTLFLLKKILFSRAEAWIKKGD